MRLDAYASEPQFCDHIAAVWRALPVSARGDFLVPSALLERGPVVHADLVTPHQDAIDPSRPVLVASYGDVTRMRAMGRTRIACIEHGAGQSYGGDPKSAANSSYAGGKGRADVELFLVPNEYSAARMRTAYPAARVEVVGCPKLETLPARSPAPGPVVAISFHFPIHIVPEMDSAIGHFRPALPALAAVFTVLGHGHPKVPGVDWPRRLARIYRRAEIEHVPDFAEVCRRADVYVCDNSSTIFEFASTGRPVVLLNSPDYRRTVNHGGRFWDWAGVGLQCDDTRALIPTIMRALEDSPEVRAKREATLDLVYAHRSGAAGLAAAVLADWIGTRTARAA